jgi:hypothetical protein
MQCLLVRTVQSLFLETVLILFYYSNCDKKTVRDSFLSKGSVSTLRTHISRNANSHYPMYIESCTKRGLDPHDRCKPKDEDTNTQTRIDDVFSKQSRQAAFCREGLLQHVCTLVAEDDQVCSIYSFGYAPSTNPCLSGLPSPRIRRLPCRSSIHTPWTQGERYPRPNDCPAGDDRPQKSRNRHSPKETSGMY